MKKSVLLLTCIGVCAMLLAACGKGEKFSAGTEMNADEARAYREKLLAEQEAEKAAQKEESTAPNTEEPAQNTEENAQPGEVALPAVCYYTEKGSKWHASADCHYLQNSKEILQGSVDSACYAGKSQPCSGCASMYMYAGE